MNKKGNKLPKTVYFMTNNVAEPIINNSICPANILANNLTEREIGLKKKESTSIKTNKGANQLGIPEGRKTLKKDKPKFFKANKTQARKKVKAKKKVTER